MEAEVFQCIVTCVVDIVQGEGWEVKVEEVLHFVMCSMWCVHHMRGGLGGRGRGGRSMHTLGNSSRDAGKVA